MSSATRWITTLPATAPLPGGDARITHGSTSSAWSASALATVEDGEEPCMREWMEKYRDRPMDLADAALGRGAEREDLTRIFTLDRRHFSVYRPGRRRRFSILPG